MKPTATIRLLTDDKYKKGDLFTRLMEDLFFSLGYDRLRFDVHKQGREIDVQGRHRHEPRLLRAECKAHADKMGGSELNKFLGVVTRERRTAQKNDESVAAYFISLSGFTETSIDQEEEFGADKTVLFSGQDVIKELEKSKLLVGDAEATSQAGQCVQVAGAEGLDPEEIEVLGHEIGYVKAVYYEMNKQRTHFALIHAEGKPLAEATAKRLIAADEAEGGVLHTLRYLPPKPPRPDYRQQKEEAMGHYRRWLAEECGYIQLDGMPTDNELGPRKLELERLFVPLNVILLEEPKDDDEDLPFEGPKRRPIRELLTDATHIALLASPGGGKSTLLKRLATAYAFPERRADIADDLPAHNWLPLFVRCRELQERANQPITTLLGDIAAKAEMPAELVEAFKTLIDEALQSGQVLLLVDGLDEISDERFRAAFANNLRSFLGVFPRTALVVTSREAGFRLVAGTIASACHHQARLAPFEFEDVRKLCVQWHVEVIKDSSSVRADAEKLAVDIWENERIRALAENPLLLTTLLVVKRWIGELPRNRAALYGVAVQVLVRTWNVEGYESLDEEETLAQLSYIACAMMEEGVQQLSHNALLKLLKEARQVLEVELRYTTISPAKFIERVESRSSLLMQTGRAVIEGELQPVYEFRHLTFQEYLAARGYVKEQHSRRSDDIPLVNLLEPHFMDERWREVIPLAAVLAERKAENTIKSLVKYSLDKEQIKTGSNPYTLSILARCIVDEVKISSATLVSALEAIGSSGRQTHIIQIAGMLMASKVGELFQSIVEAKYTSEQENWEEYATSLSEVCYPSDTEFTSEDALDEFVEDMIKLLRSDKPLEQIKGAIQLMSFSYEHSTANSYFTKDGSEEEADYEDFTHGRAQEIRDLLAAMIHSGYNPSVLAASWALVWCKLTILHETHLQPEDISQLVNIWYNHPKTETARFAAWATYVHPLLERSALTNLLPIEGEFDKFLLRAGGSGSGIAISNAAITIGWYRRSPWNDEELAELIKESYGLDNKSARHRSDLRNPKQMLAALGEAGERVLQERSRLEAEMQQEQSAQVITRA